MTEGLNNEEAPVGNGEQENGVNGFGRKFAGRGTCRCGQFLRRGMRRGAMAGQRGGYGSGGIEVVETEIGPGRVCRRGSGAGRRGGKGRGNGRGFGGNR